MRHHDSDLEACRVIADRIVAPDMANLPEWGHCTDYIGGVAGQGILLLQVWEATGQVKWLDRARALGAWLATHRSEQGPGIAWHVSVPVGEPPVYWGFAHGLAGIGHFLARLYTATGAHQWRDLCEGAARALEAAAVQDHGGLNWNRGPALEPVSRCQWCHGSPGVGLFFVSAAEHLKEPRYLDLAAQAATCVLAYGDIRRNPSQCHGLAGNGELFIELFRVTGQSRWLDHARLFMEMASAYRSTDAAGVRWQADEPGFHSPDFMCGAAGTGHFFLRISESGRLPLPLM